jgi:geranylgeranyl diphosphate synthase, type I
VSSQSEGLEAPQQHGETAPGRLFLDFTRRLQPTIQRCLKRHLSAELTRLRPLGPEALTTCRALTDVCLRGGKRLRAALVVAGGRCFGERADDELLIEIGAAVEVLHTYFLVHDDWMDGDLERRGGLSAHAQLRNIYGQSKGDAAAVLAGDWGATIANDWMTQMSIAPRKLARVLGAFAAMQRAALGGQMRDILAQDKRIELTYRLKTASYTVEGPLVLGALVSGATSQQLETLHRFSLPAGVAFQLRDDLMSLFGSSKQTGKPFGSDLRAGKRTSVVLHALAAASGTDRKTIENVFGNPKATMRDLRAAVASIDHVGSRLHVERRIARLTANACRALQQPWISESARSLLTSSAFALAVRSH